MDKVLALLIIDLGFAFRIKYFFQAQLWVISQHKTSPEHNRTRPQNKKVKKLIIYNYYDKNIKNILYLGVRTIAQEVGRLHCKQLTHIWFPSTKYCPPASPWKIPECRNRSNHSCGTKKKKKTVYQCYN